MTTMTAAPARRAVATTVTAADAETILRDLSTLRDRAPEMARELHRSFGSTYSVLERALTNGRINASAKTSAKVACLRDGIADRLADTPASR